MSISKALSSLAEIESILELATRTIMEDASEDILETFRLDYVTKYAYGNGVFSGKGGSFRDAWIWGDIKKHANILVMEMFNDWATMAEPDSRGTPPFRHTTFTSSGTRWADDSRPYLAETLDNSPINKNRDVWLSQNVIGGYWTKFIEKELNSGGLKKIIDKHAIANGFVIGGNISIR